jgi:uncharacterized protein
MALTNYLMQSAFGITIFYGVGFGLVGRVGPMLLLPIALLVCGVQAQMSALWLRSFRYEPMEWLWRSLTYGDWQPMRMRSATPPPTPPLAPLPVATPLETAGVLVSLFPQNTHHSRCSDSGS